MDPGIVRHDIRKSLAVEATLMNAVISLILNALAMINHFGNRTRVLCVGTFS